MTEIAAVPWNGLNVVSTFSGCGGSCLGFRMAGYRVLWANEFIPAAAETYRANHPTTILDTGDIRKVQPEAILKAIGLKAGELDAMEGSPPCASFSTAGKREKHWGKAKKYSDTVQRVDDLFFEYVRLLRGLRPKVFVAENVSGLVKGVAKGYFLEILGALKACGYRVGCKVLDAQWLGVPQARQRTIFIGVREDLGEGTRVPEAVALPLQPARCVAVDRAREVRSGVEVRRCTQPDGQRPRFLQPGDEPPGPGVGRGPVDGRDGRGVRSQGEGLRPSMNRAPRSWERSRTSSRSKSSTWGGSPSPRNGIG